MKKLFLTLAFSFICLFAYAASPVTYYFNAYDSGGEEWTTDPENMVDGSISTYAYLYSGSPSAEVQLLTGNTCDGTNLGTITKVELRIWGVIESNPLKLRPIFSGGDGDDHLLTDYLDYDWTDYVDITSDTNSPETWSWANVQALNCDVDGEWTYEGGELSVTKVEIRVTYTGGAAARRIIMIQ